MPKKRKITKGDMDLVDFMRQANEPIIDGLLDKAISGAWAFIAALHYSFLDDEAIYKDLQKTEVLEAALELIVQMINQAVEHGDMEIEVIYKSENSDDQIVEHGAETLRDNKLCDQPVFESTHFVLFLKTSRWGIKHGRETRATTRATKSTKTD